MKPIHLFLVCLFFSIVSCMSPQRMLDEGRHKMIFNKYHQKGKKGKLSSEDLDFLVKGINAWNDSRTFELSKLLAGTSDKDWKKGIKMLDKIDKQQSKFAAYSQLDEINELSAINTVDWESKYNNRLYEYYHDIYDQHLQNYADNGQRNEVIKAHKVADKIEKYTADEAYVYDLKTRCVKLGHRTFRYTGSFCNNINWNDNLWNTYDNGLPDSLTDYHIYMALDGLNELDRCDNNYLDFSKEVVDYYETEKDTLGNETETPIYKTIQAQIKESTYSYSVEGTASLIIVHLVSGQKVVNTSYTHTETDEVVLYFLNSGEEEAVPEGYSLESFSFVSYDYGDITGNVMDYLTDAVLGGLNSSNIY